ncbi:MAG: MFS transporter [Lachnospiraceae bacterium]|jgi:fucose permease|nr:MFS transporter [Lachnospiraceae bacterium]
MITLLILIITYIAFISLGLPDSIMGSSWPVIYQDIGASIEDAGIIFIIVSIGTVLSSFFSDKIIRRLGTGMVTAISVMLTAAALLGNAFGQDFRVFCLLAIPMGLGAGSVDAALNNYVALNYSARHMNWLHCFWAVGAAIGPMIMSHFISGKMTGNWAGGYRIIGFIQLTLALLLFISLPLWKRAEGKLPPETKKKEPVKLGEVLRLPGAIKALIAFFCYCGMESTIGLWGGSFLVMARDLPAETAARVVALFYFGIMIGRFLSGILVAKLNSKKMIRIGEILMIAGLIWILLPGIDWIMYCGFFLIGAGCAPIYPSLIHETPANFGSKYSQAMIGIQMAFAYIGNIIMPPVFGLVGSQIGYGAYPFYLILSLILMTIMAEGTVRRTA